MPLTQPDHPPPVWKRLAGRVALALGTYALGYFLYFLAFRHGGLLWGPAVIVALPVVALFEGMRAGGAYVDGPALALLHFAALVVQYGYLRLLARPLRWARRRRADLP